MEGGFILCFAAVMLFMAPGVKGTSHLAFNAGKEVNITRSGCGETKHCVATPADCDPEGSATCLFGSAVSTAPVASNGVTATIQLSGTSTGYIALGLTADATQGTTMLFICAKGVSQPFTFSTFLRLNTDGSLVAKEIRVTEIRHVETGSLIKCEFDVPGLSASSTRNSLDTSFQVLMGSGTYNSGPGPFNVDLTSDLLDLTQPRAATTTAATSTTATPTTAGASSVLHSYALLLLLSVVALSFTHRA